MSAKPMGRLALVPLAATAFMLAAACGLGPAGADGGSKIEVVAAESFWGSIAGQIAGDRAHVTSIIVNPGSDPHDYEATPGDARTVARATYVIVNGAGYDPWVPKLLAANPVSGRTVLTISDLFGKKEGDNPHFWYSPGYVDQVVDRIASDLGKIEPADASYWRQQGVAYKSDGLRHYHDTIGEIGRKYGGTRVGASESIFSYLAGGLGLDLITPGGYLKAISDGTDPSPADKAEAENQVATGQVKVLVFNAQNSTPDVRALVDLARAKGIPVATMTETPTPATATFQDWQTAQLTNLLTALGG
jgi:zinc/manganese transport system substrate-binding protein